MDEYMLQNLCKVLSCPWTKDTLISMVQSQPDWCPAHLRVTQNNNTRENVKLNPKMVSQVKSDGEDYSLENNIW